jgi:hypothetical protein
VRTRSVDCVVDKGFTIATERRGFKSRHRMIGHVLQKNSKLLFRSYLYGLIFFVQHNFCYKKVYKKFTVMVYGKGLGLRVRVKILGYSLVLGLRA